jgi:glycosyltransferase involved in cell wall biosynthesis
MTILWLLEIDPHYGLRHGATLRYANLSRGLRDAGHRVHYIVNNFPGTDRSQRNQFLDALYQEQRFDSYVELEAPPYPQPRAKLSGLLIWPGARNWVLRDARRAYCERVVGVAKEVGADLFIVSDRRSLFVLPHLRERVRTIIDWCDSIALYQTREIRRLLRSFELAKLPSSLWRLLTAALDECCYGRMADANLVVSSVDRLALNRLNRRPDRNFVLPNGIVLHASSRAPEKEPNTVIFTGSMSYAPNYTGALWLIDHVLPLLLRRNPNVRLVIAGQEPVPALRAKAGPNVEVTGLVPDLGARIARSQLCVAPLFSGGGFRNKVVEAINSETYVLGTPMALEALDARLQDQLLCASTPQQFADLILDFLNHPRTFDDRLRESVRIVREEYSWSVRAGQMETLCTSLAAPKGGQIPRWSGNSK